MGVSDHWGVPYFGVRLDRVVLMRQPSGGRPGVDPFAWLIIAFFKTFLRASRASGDLVRDTGALSIRIRFWVLD